MWVLGIDSSGLELAVALTGPHGVAAQATSTARRGQGDVLLPLVTDICAQAGLELRDLGALAVVTGPGSFTGLRVGIAAAQGLAHALQLPCAGYDRFTLLRPQVGQAVLVFESLRAELFVQVPGQPAQMLTPAQISALAPKQIAGDGAAHLPGSAVLAVPAAAQLAAQAAREALIAGVALPPPVPFYVRLPDVTGAAAAS